MDNSNINVPPQPSNPPSLIGGHTEYMKGTVQSTIGAMTGSHAWTASGEQAKAHAKHDLKVAGMQRSTDTRSLASGKVEEAAGKLVGCDGMKLEGQAINARKDA